MPMTNPVRARRLAAPALAAALALGLSACSTPSGPASDNATLYSVNQPVVERSNFTMDLATTSSGLPISEQSRLADWFETLDLGYGDRVALDASVASEPVRDDIAALAGRHGVLLADGAPVTEGYVDPGMVRVVVTRSSAYVPGCPNWEGKQTGNYGNKTSPGYGCSVNGNLAAMIADPEHLLQGAEGTGETVIMQSNKAIDQYRERAPSGGGGNVTDVASNQGGGGN